MKRADGWWWRGPGTAGLLVVVGLGVCLPGAVLAWVSHALGGPPP